MASHSEIIPEATRVAVVGAGTAGVAAAAAAAEAGAHVLLLDKADGTSVRLPPLVTRAPGSFVVDFVLERGRFLGLLVLEGGMLRVLRASTCVLTTGTVDGLFRRSDRTGDGLAIAARAGAALSNLDAWALDGEAVDFAGGVYVVDGLTSIENVFAAGDVAARGPEGRGDPADDGRRAGERAAKQKGLPPAPGHLHMRPSIDTPLPPGFADVKMERLRRAMREAATEPARQIPVVLRLKGEADDFARARPQPELYAFQNACEVAMLLLKAKVGSH